eukprot:TRINITY_DN5124_c0_g1_i1.p1 TRINITY_DN5124_c0_g1~~TRINITY_DN5124_c0_g1_i1.p1  ORF type:complete len:475 (-),score=130.31 TRINITY_DN5124_c0_g1_i1:17-1279(-)
MNLQQEQLEQSQSQFEDLRLTFLQKEEELAQEKVEFEKMKIDFFNQQNNQISSMTDLESLKTDHAQEIAEYEDKILSLEKKIMKKNDKIKEIKEEKKFAKDQFIQKEELFNLQMRNLQGKIDQMIEKEKTVEERKKFIDERIKELEARENIIKEQEDKYKEEIQKDNEEKYTQELLAHTTVSTSQVFHEDLINLKEENEKLHEQITEYELKLRDQAETIEIQLNRQIDLENTIEMLQEEIQSKNTQVSKYGNKLKQIQQRETHKKTSSQIRYLEQECDKLRDAIQAHQSQNSFLHQMIERITNEKRGELLAKKKTIQYYQDLLNAAQKECNELKQYIFMKKISNTSEFQEDEIQDEIATNFMYDYEELKRSYFFSLSISIKLSRSIKGLSTNIDAQELYEEAQNLDFTEWDNWLHHKLEE